ncbi:DUF305 domain-containing protein [Cupriavidus basilensis]
MAMAELRYGRNEQLRRIAQEIIVEQLREIAAMRLALGQPLPPSAPAPTARACRRRPDPAASGRAQPPPRTYTDNKTRPWTATPPNPSRPPRPSTLLLGLCSARHWPGQAPGPLSAPRRLPISHRGRIYAAEQFSEHGVGHRPGRQQAAGRDSAGRSDTGQPLSPLYRGQLARTWPGASPPTGACWRWCRSAPASVSFIGHRHQCGQARDLRRTFAA